MKTWQQVWNKRENVRQKLSLQTLLQLDGFDTGAGIIDELIWQRYVEWISNQLELGKSDSVFEIGCGAGALLYEMQNGRRAVAGWDYGRTLIEAAERVMPAGIFQVKSAGALAELTETYDMVLANSVFQYFPSLEYAAKVIDEMVRCAEQTVGIFDIYDRAHRQAMEKTKRRALGEKVYDEKYQGLRHAYYDRQWFKDMAKRQGLVAEVFNQWDELAAVSPYRFNVIIRKT